MYEEMICDNFTKWVNLEESIEEKNEIAKEIEKMSFSMGAEWL